MTGARRKGKAEGKEQQKEGGQEGGKERLNGRERREREEWIWANRVVEGKKSL